MASLLGKKPKNVFLVTKNQILVAILFTIKTLHLPDKKRVFALFLLQSTGFLLGETVLFLPKKGFLLFYL